MNSISVSFLILLLIGDSGERNKNDIFNQNSSLCVSNDLQNLKTASFKDMYTEDAIKIFEDGRVLEGLKQIEDYHNSNPLTIDTIWTVYKVRASDQFAYEIGISKSGTTTYKHLLITTISEKPLRAFEFIAYTNESTGAKEDIDKRRAKWIELCNEHNVEDLVRQLYSKKPIYYNHKPLILSQDSLIREYRYMNHPKYSLNLEPEHLEMVTDTLAFEIGQCSGGYNGKYILIWQMDDNGEWKVMVDSNI